VQPSGLFRALFTSPWPGGHVHVHKVTHSNIKAPCRLCGLVCGHCRENGPGAAVAHVQTPRCLLAQACQHTRQAQPRRLACSHSWFRNVNFAQPPNSTHNAIILSMTRCPHVLEHTRAQWYTYEWCSKIEQETDTKPRAPCCAADLLRTPPSTCATASSRRQTPRRPRAGRKLARI